MNYILIFFAGGCGSLLRYAIGLMLPASFFPWATLGINVIGSFVLGLFGGLGARFGWSESVHLALTVGLCGGFTTFSTFMNENLLLSREGALLAAVLYTLGSMALGLLAVVLGYQIAK